MFESKSLSRMISDVVTSIVSKTNIESVEPGTVLRQLIDQQALQVYELQRFVQLLASSTFLTEQSGQFLDTIATIFGLARQPQTVVQSVGGIRFYTETGDQICNYISDSFFSENQVIVYDKYGGQYNVERTQIPQYKMSHQYVTLNQTPIEIARESISAGEINQYTPTIPGVLVTNTSNLQLVQSAETDSQLRYRIQQHLNSYRMATSQQLRLQQMSVPGVQDQRVIEFPRGIGSVDVYILGLDINTDEQLIQPVLEQVKPYVQAGIDLDVKTFIKTYVILGGIVRQVQNANQQNVLDQIESVQRSAIDIIQPGGTMNKFDLLSQIIRSCDLIKTIDDFAVYIKQPSKFQVPNKLYQDTYYCSEKEKLLLAPTDWQVFKIL